MGPPQGVYLYTTPQHRKTLTYIQALGGIRTHDPSDPAIQDRAL